MQLKILPSPFAPV